MEWELIPGNAQGHLRTLQVCAGDMPGLMGQGTGPPDGQAKVRQGDGPAAGRAGQGGPGTPVSLQMELSRAICPRSAGPARAGSRDLAAEKEKGMPRLGNLQGLGPITGVSNPLGIVCQHPVQGALLLPHTSQAFPGGTSLSFSSASLSPLSHSSGICS